MSKLKDIFKGTFSKDDSVTCVWPGVVLNGDIKGFIKWFKDEFDCDIEYIGELTTRPDRDDPNNTGERIDQFFNIKSNIGSMIIPRLQLGFKWMDDFVDNYPELSYVWDNKSESISLNDLFKLMKDKE